MTARLPTCAAVALLLAGTPFLPARAATVKGVSVPATVTVAEHTLTLQGAGVRKKFFFSVYVGALYLAHPAPSAAAAVAADEPKRIALWMLRDVDGEAIAEAIEDGFFKNSQDRLDRLRARIDRLKALFTDELPEGRQITFTYLPGTGTAVAFDGAVRETIGGTDFMEGLWAIWLGEVPADHDLKKAMQGP